jgi:hypothetical protein
MTRRNLLRVPDQGPCAGHPCDDCERCRVGDCCGSDVGEAGLPLQGSWPHTWHGRLGVLRRTASGWLVCACCGTRTENLARHAQAHGLSADAYRAMWGLNCTTALVSARLRALRADLGLRYGHRLSDSEAGRPTSEQRSRWARNREARAETQLRRGGQPRTATGQWQPREGRILPRRPPLTTGDLR